MTLRNTRPAVWLREAHQAGRPVMLAIEVVGIAVVAVGAAWVASAPSDGGLAIVSALALAVSVLLFAVASVVLPADAPPAPSWFASRRTATTRE